MLIVGHIILTLVALAALLSSSSVSLAATAAGIPATPLMTVYQFDGPATVPFYEVTRFLREGPSSSAGSLAQGSSVLPCLVIRDGQPVTDKSGTPFVGFEVVVDARDADPASAVRFKEVFEQRKTMSVANHHCPRDARHVIDVRKLHALGKPPRFDPPWSAAHLPEARTELDGVVRAFHASGRCDAANRRLMGRREALRQAWSGFIADNARQWSTATLTHARHLDFVMRTALYEGHLGRGCSAYGACERNVIALSIRNRVRERCLRGQGCAEEGDFEGVASKTSQYNIWDEFLTQTSGLTSCFLRPDLAGQDHYAKLQAMYEQSLGDFERILFGAASDLEAAFPGNARADVLALRHYYHPPAMGKCFPDHKRLEYISGAIAHRGDTFALIAGTRIEAGEKRGGGYFFREVEIGDEGERDVVRVLDRYPGFVVDARKVTLASPTSCTPHGVPRSCRFEDVGRHRKTPGWLAAGKQLQLSCRVRARGEDCRRLASLETAKVGGRCDTWMQPVAGVP